MHETEILYIPYTSSRLDTNAVGRNIISIFKIYASQKNIEQVSVDEHLGNQELYFLHITHDGRYMIQGLDDGENLLEISKLEDPANSSPTQIGKKKEKGCYLELKNHGVCHTVNYCQDSQTLFVLTTNKIMLIYKLKDAPVAKGGFLQPLYNLDNMEVTT